ncbi:MAG TPA: hypothetical protein VGH82_04700 [Gaiellaceae bacterium]
MKRTLVSVGVVLATIVICVTPSGTAATAGHLSGGGTASISQVAFNVTIDRAGGASGSFECLMAGRSAFVLGAFGLAHIMQVHATPTAGSISGSVVSFSGPGKLVMDGGQHMSIDVTVWANVATQQFQLTVVQVGAMPVENFVSGGFSLR